MPDSSRRSVLDGIDHFSDGCAEGKPEIKSQFMGVSGPKQKPARRRFFCVPKEGFEPSRDCSHHALNVARLPVPPLRLMLSGIVGGLYFIAKMVFVNL